MSNATKTRGYAGNVASDGDKIFDKLQVGESTSVMAQINCDGMLASDAVVSIECSIGGDSWSPVVNAGTTDPVQVTLSAATQYILVAGLKPGTYARVVFTQNTANSGTYSIQLAY